MGISWREAVERLSHQVHLIRTELLMAKRHRSIRTLRDLQDEAAAAEALGLNQDKPTRARGERAPRIPGGSGGDSESRSRPSASPRMRVVWAVCDVGGRTVATYEYPQKAEAEAHAAQLVSRGKGHHFVRSEKQPIG
jgi:hypothetical protein